MKGLLYKDYIVNNGKFAVVAILVQMAIVVVLRMNYNVLIETEVVSIYICCLLLIVSMYVVLFFMADILLKRDSHMHKQFAFSMPISKEDYVRSKYVYGLLAVVIVSIVFIAEYYLIKSGIKTDSAKTLMKNIGKIVSPLISAVVITLAVELAFGLWLGPDVGKIVKEVLVIVVALGVLAYAFFGDLDAIKNWNLMNVLEKLVGDSDNMYLLQVGAPIVSVLAYILSYLIIKEIIKKKLTN